MSNLTIYLPPALAERVKRHRAQLRVSQTCARALERKVERLERDAASLPTSRGAERE